MTLCQRERERERGGARFDDVAGTVGPIPGIVRRGERHFVAAPRLAKLFGVRRIRRILGRIAESTLFDEFC